MKQVVFAVFLLAMASLMGCLNEDDLTSDTTEQIGEDNMNSLEKRVLELEAKIAQYENPKVFFADSGENGSAHCGVGWSNKTECFLIIKFYDVDGIVESYSIESSVNGTIASECSKFQAGWIGDLGYMVLGSPDSNDCLVFFAGGDNYVQTSHFTSSLTSYVIIDVCNQLYPADQQLIVSVNDNNGNQGSASYDLSYQSYYEDFGCE